LNTEDARAVPDVSVVFQVPPNDASCAIHVLDQPFMSPR
jgi:hypothetical protein